jgi:hypothetical protein
MKLRIGTLGILSSLALAACGHGSAEAPRTAASVHGGTGSEESGAPIASGSGYQSPSAEPAPPPAVAGAPASAPSRGAAADEAKAESESRPGLGTSWGEAVESRVSRTSFVRGSDSPFATASFFYNDEAGAAAMVGGRSTDSSDSVVAVRGGSVMVSLTDSSGRPLRALHADGRTVAIGNDGDRYVIRVDNRSPFRVETVASVDGLDVVDGDDGDLRKRGYVLGPHDTLEIEGFRESAGTVRAFRFGSVKDSYADRRGKGRNVGVVGVALFEEQGADWRWTPEEVNRRQTADPFPNHFAPAPPPAPPGQWRAE